MTTRSDPTGLVEVDRARRDHTLAATTECADLDIAGGWVNNTIADIHEGLRRLVADIRATYPRVAA